MSLAVVDVVLAPPSSAGDEFALLIGADDDMKDDVVDIAATRGEAVTDETVRDDSINDDGDEEMCFMVASVLLRTGRTNALNDQK